MADLREYRAKMDEIDNEILALFQKRMKTSLEIAQLKQKDGLFLRDEAREREILARAAETAGEELAPYAEKLFGKLLELSRAYQRRSLARMREHR